eukprot:SAG31_NODE_29880_length_388_cov_1.252595_2_plen_24_part_01
MSHRSTAVDRGIPLNLVDLGMGTV